MTASTIAKVSAMDFARFCRLLDVYRLAPRQHAVMAECARLAQTPSEWVDLVVLAQTLADPMRRRADVKERVGAMARYPFGHMVATLG